MNAVTVLEAKSSLEQLIRLAVQDLEPTIVVTDGGEKAVVVALDQFNSWQETIYLLSSPANAVHLRRSLAEARRGEVLEHPLND